MSGRPLEIADISLRQKERGLVVGGTDTGKSTLSDVLGADFVRRYARAGARELILDSKPRYRAEKTAQGLSAKRRYKNWDHGQPVRGSVVVDDPSDLKMVWDMGYRRVIIQGEGGRADLDRMTEAARLFLLDSRAKRPQLLRVDETMDFYHPNGQPRGGGDDVINRAARAGRERGTAVLCCSQRTRGIPTQLMEEMSRLYAFRLDYRGDAKRFQEMGAPEFALPTETRRFMYWWKGAYGHVYGPYTLNLR